VPAPFFVRHGARGAHSGWLIRLAVLAVMVVLLFVCAPQDAGAWFSRREILDFRQPASAGRFFANASLRRSTRLANATRMDAAEAEEVVCG
jgi:hypothetical protein